MEPRKCFKIAEQGMSTCCTQEVHAWAHSMRAASRGVGGGAGGTGGGALRFGVFPAKNLSGIAGDEGEEEE